MGFNISLSSFKINRAFDNIDFSWPEFQPPMIVFDSDVDPLDDLPSLEELQPLNRRSRSSSTSSAVEELPVTELDPSTAGGPETRQLAKPGPSTSVEVEELPIVQPGPSTSSNGKSNLSSVLKRGFKRRQSKVTRGISSWGRIFRFVLLGKDSVVSFKYFDPILGLLAPFSNAEAEWAKAGLPYRSGELKAYGTKTALSFALNFCDSDFSLLCQSASQRITRILTMEREKHSLVFLRSCPLCSDEGPVE
ncbi:hypothetical protein KQX54_013669 [Cotesia glomerata]|uniref:Uncharacterized protein n=1 Tax=Cotesia glomerata TaxID=32391 RepID=A0AAV7I185_COTGL|nr:hypothetical protein KQX54_013669 [Cotesia glomerata]